MNYARIINKIAVDVSTTPFEQFHPDIAAEFVEVPANVVPGSTVDAAGVWTIAPIVQVAANIQAVINFTYPSAAAKATDITVDLSVVNPTDNSPLPVTETYYVPLMNVITGAMEQMLVVPVVDGIGQVVFQVATAGLYSIKTDLIRPIPTALFSETPDIAVY